MARQVKGTVIALAAALGLLSLCAVLISAAVLPEKTADGCVITCCFLGALTGGGIVMRGGGKHTVLHGLGVGMALAAILAVSGLLLYSSTDIPWCTVLVSACLFGGGAAGLAGGRKSGRRRN